MTEENQIKERGPGPFMMSIYIILFLIIAAYLFFGVFSPWYYGKSARVMAIKTMHAQTIKYIKSEHNKCKIGESKFMNNSQDCPATATKAVTGAVATMTDKNPFDTSKNAVREFNDNKDDKDVGFISLSVSGTTVVIRSCISKPCYDEKNRLQDSIEIK